jgi:hypothetical protein
METLSQSKSKKSIPRPNIVTQSVLLIEATPNISLDSVRFAHWPLRDEAAQRR